MLRVSGATRLRQSHKQKQLEMDAVAQTPTKREKQQIEPLANILNHERQRASNGGPSIKPDHLAATTSSGVATGQIMVSFGNPLPQSAPPDVHDVPPLPKKKEHRAHGVLYALPGGSVGRWNSTQSAIMCTCDPTKGLCTGGVRRLQ